MKWDKWANRERRGTQAIRVLLVDLVFLGREGIPDHRVELARWGHTDHTGLQDQRDFLETLEYRVPTVHLGQRVSMSPEGPKARQDHREHRGMKDHSAHLAPPARLGDREGKATSANPARTASRERKETWEMSGRLDHKVHWASLGSLG